MTRRRPLAIPAIIAAGIARAERERKANVIARPMRNLMDMLKQGEVFEIDGRAVMLMPEVGEQFATRAEWCEIAPVINGKPLPKRAQVRMCGNSVSPPLAAALARANVPELMTFNARELRALEAA